MQADTSIREEIQCALAQHGACFGEPHDLPPKRACDHRIPLMEGASPISVKPCRVSPQQKDELEKHVAKNVASQNDSTKP